LISSDQLWGFDLNAALGLNYIQFRHFSLGVELNPGITIWGFNTREGFSNDIFYPFWYFKTNFNLMINGKTESVDEPVIDLRTIFNTLQNLQRFFYVFSFIIT
jgi:hypothetical protein